MKKLVAEFVGTFILVFGGCGAAVFAGHAIGLVGISLAFGLTVVGCAYALGPVSGCHLNPAVSIGLVAGGRFPAKDLPGYILAQVAGAIAGAGLIYAIMLQTPLGYDPIVTGMASNGYGPHSPGIALGEHIVHFNMVGCFVAEAIFTFIFLTVILGATSARGMTPVAGLVIGLTLTLVHLMGIPITNLSVNPARSTGPALFVHGWALEQLWLFWVAPIVGAGVAGGLARYLHDDSAIKANVAEAVAKAKAG
jgi:aquaporin Z